MAQNYLNTNIFCDSSGYCPETGGFEPSDFLLMEDDWLDGLPTDLSHLLNCTPNDSGVDPNGTSYESSLEGNMNNRESDGRRDKKGTREKVAFKTKSDIEILNDGFKWRKYGKKMVKNNQNPRNYYKCSVEGCSVKKRVERDNQDRRYVITTYEGIHNHEGPTI